MSTCAAQELLNQTDHTGDVLYEVEWCHNKEGGDLKILQSYSAHEIGRSRPIPRSLIIWPVTDKDIDAQAEDLARMVASQMRVTLQLITQKKRRMSCWS